MNKKQRDRVNNLINKFEQDIKSIVGGKYDFSMRSNCTQTGSEIKEIVVTFKVKKKENEEEQYVQ